MATLPDPLGDRTVKAVKVPPQRPISYKEMYPNPSNYLVPSNTPMYLGTPTIPDLAKIR